MSLGPGNTLFRYENGNSVVVWQYTDNFTLTPEQNGGIVEITSASGKTLTVPATLPEGFNCVVVQGGAGQITITGSSTTINNVASQSKTSGQWAAVTLSHLYRDSFLLAGSTGA